LNHTSHCRLSRVTRVRVTVCLATGSDESVLPSVDPGRRSYVWFYSLDLRIEMQSADCSYVSHSNFSYIVLSQLCVDIQIRRIKWTKICSFSISADISSVFFVDNVPYTPVVGFMSFISPTQRIALGAVHDWLTHPKIINLKLTPIANWHEHTMIKTFLSESALQDPADTSAASEGNQPQPAIRGPMKPAGSKSHRGQKPIVVKSR
jgi:hypothetical protein